MIGAITVKARVETALVSRGKEAAWMRGAQQEKVGKHKSVVFITMQGRQQEIFCCLFFTKDQGYVLQTKVRL